MLLSRLPCEAFSRLVDAAFNEFSNFELSFISKFTNSAQFAHVVNQLQSLTVNFNKPIILDIIQGGSICILIDVLESVTTLANLMESCFIACEFAYIQMRNAGCTKVQLSFKLPVRIINSGHMLTVLDRPVLLDCLNQRTNKNIFAALLESASSNITSGCTLKAYYESGTITFDELRDALALLKLLSRSNPTLALLDVDEMRDTIKFSLTDIALAAFGFDKVRYVVLSFKQLLDRRLMPYPGLVGTSGIDNASITMFGAVENVSTDDIIKAKTELAGDDQGKLQDVVSMSDFLDDVCQLDEYECYDNILDDILF